MTDDNSDNIEEIKAFPAIWLLINAGNRESKDNCLSEAKAFFLKAKEELAMTPRTDLFLWDNTEACIDGCLERPEIKSLH